MNKQYFFLALLIILIPVLGRLAFNHFDASVFIVAGRQFADEAKLPGSIKVFDGSGYDGQLYFKMALDLFSDTSEDGKAYQILSYRKQRILYPVVSWLVAFGKPEALPTAMIITNCLFFLGIWFIFFSICKKYRINLLYSILPLLYSGFHMSLGRDLAEPMEAFFVLGLLFFITFNSSILFCILATLAFFTKETTIVFILPITIFLIINKYRKKSLNWKLLALLSSPYIIFFIWKFYLYYQLDEHSLIQGTANFGFPFLGLFKGFSQYFNDISVKSMLAFSVALLHLTWLIWLISTVFPYIKKSFLDKSYNNYPEIAWTLWLAFSIFFSEKIFEDDWSFVKVFTSFCTISFFILFLNRHKFNKYFCIYTVFMFLLTTFRLWIRP